jgi:hypothetical protein
VSDVVDKKTRRTKQEFSYRQTNIESEDREMRIFLFPSVTPAFSIGHRGELQHNNIRAKRFALIPNQKNSLGRATLTHPTDHRGMIEG